MQGPVSINAINDNNFRREPYGKSKWQAEQLLAAASKDGLETVTLRPSVVYGPGAVNGMILNLCRLISRGKFFIIGSGRNIIPLVFIDDLIEAFLRSTDGGVSGAAYEVIGPEAPTLGEVVKQIAENLGPRAASGSRWLGWRRGCPSSSSGVGARALAHPAAGQRHHQPPAAVELPKGQR